MVNTTTLNYYSVQEKENIMTIFKRKNSFKQFLALLVVFTLICPGALSAQKKKHGAWLTVIKQDMQMVEGELLKVSDNDILLMSKSETGMTIPLNEITMIKYKKKGNFGTGFVIGLGIPMILGGLVGSALDHGHAESVWRGVCIFGGMYGIPAGFLLGLICSQTENRKTLIFQKASSQKVSKNIEKLKTLARF